jgi:hypothetical protein
LSLPLSLSLLLSLLSLTSALSPHNTFRPHPRLPLFLTITLASSEERSLLYEGFANQSAFKSAFKSALKETHLPYRRLYILHPGAVRALPRRVYIKALLRLYLCVFKAQEGFLYPQVHAKKQASDCLKSA